MEILEFTEDSLAKSLTNEFTGISVIKEKKQYLFLNDYLGDKGLKTQTIVIEEEYISKDFLEGYTSYYSYCFEKYSKNCRRVHFFKNSFDVDVFQNQLVSNNNGFWENYLGFIVVKPIPITTIGYTLLKTYGGNSNRKFWGTRDYEVHLFGKEITIDSLAFQEQDTVIAACATTAIWSMLNKASLDFHTILKSPSEITKDADNVSPDGSRLFPNRGLSLLQICQSIVNSGLVTEVKLGDINRTANEKVVSILYIKKILNAYSPIGIPIILVVQVPSGNGYGLHAVTVSGYLQKEPELKPPSIDITWYAEDIEKVYVHDDQWGPFARVNFNNDYELETHWTINDSTNRPTFVKNIVVPVYPKIRISYESIESITHGLDRILTFFFNGKIVADIIWDIKIDYSENFKKRIKHSNLKKEEKINLLTTSIPKYIWISKCYISDTELLEFVFDATGVANAMLGLNVICHLPDKEKGILRTFLEKNEATLKRLISHKDRSNYYDFFIKSL
ncbi:MAG: hypothetical protein JXQ93_01520 [Flavobacteriaceae bacterium]